MVVEDEPGAAATTANVVRGRVLPWTPNEPLHLTTQEWLDLFPRMGGIHVGTFATSQMTEAFRQKRCKKLSMLHPTIHLFQRPTRGGPLSALGESEPDGVRLDHQGFCIRRVPHQLHGERDMLGQPRA